MATSVLRIKDTNGNIIEIPAIKGDKGDTGAAGKDAVTDQTYSPKSSNAQSGIAVAEVVSTKANLQLKELDITEYTVMTDLLIGTHIYELQTLYVNSVGDYELTFTNGSTIITSPNEAFKEGDKYLITAHMDNDMGWIFDVVAKVIDLEDKADKEEWIQIAEITLDEDAVVSITTDEDGNSFALKKIYIRFNTPAVEGDSTSTAIWLHTRFTTNVYEYKPFLATKTFPRNKTKHGSFEAEIKAFWYGEARCTSSGTYGEDPSNLNPYGVRLESINTNHITGFKLCEGYSGAIPNGTYIEIWGVRA